MNTLGFINFSVLTRLLWKSADHFLPMQTFYLGVIQEVFLSVHQEGVISGCDVTVDAGLTVDVSAGLVLFNNDELVTVAAQSVSLDSADPTNPRIDRIELTYSLENNVAVIDIDGVSKQFDKVHTATAGELAGTPAGSPTIPSKTSGAISLAGITVAATQTVLTASDIIQREEYRDISRKVDNTVQEETIDNNASAGTFLPLLMADANRHQALMVFYNIRRKTDTASSGVTQSGILSLRLNSETAQWERTDEQYGNAGVLFDVEAATGRVTYESSNISGANYAGTVKYYTKAIPA